jgi:UDP-3-O-[3-hydroxymyristoyl] N-acetylglucosamine deacetylase
MWQRTIVKPIEIEGKGLHTGKFARVVIYPAEPNSGILFRRLDVGTPLLIEASFENIFSAQRRTSLGKNGVIIYTVEHLLAALYGMRVSNALIEVEGEEIPALDGSSAHFVSLIKGVGVIEQDEKANIINLKENVWVKNGEAHILAIPYPKLKITYLIDFNRSYACEQIASFIIDEAVFEKEIAPARTFGFEHEVEDLLRNGCALGGSLENAILITNEGPAIPLRFEDELVRHKILDLIGDLSLLGSYINCHIIAIKASHSLHLELVKRIAQQANRRWKPRDKDK